MCVCGGIVCLLGVRDGGVGGVGSFAVEAVAEDACGCMCMCVCVSVLIYMYENRRM